jgi:hypothetical protein
VTTYLSRQDAKRPGATAHPGPKTFVVPLRRGGEVGRRTATARGTRATTSAKSNSGVGSVHLMRRRVAGTASVNGRVTSPQTAPDASPLTGAMTRRHA